MIIPEEQKNVIHMLFIDFLIQHVTKLIEPKGEGLLQKRRTLCEVNFRMLCALELSCAWGWRYSKLNFHFQCVTVV